MPWSACDSATKLRSELIEFIDTWVHHERYLERLPNAHVKLLRQGDRQTTGVQVVLMTEAEEGATYSYIPQSGAYEGLPILCETHRVGIMVKADRKSKGADAVEPLMGIIKAIFGCPGTTEERDDLISRGIYNLFESVGEVMMDPGANDEEGITTSQPLTLTCDTETLIR